MISYIRIYIYSSNSDILFGHSDNDIDTSARPRRIPSSEPSSKRCHGWHATPHGKPLRKTLSHAVARHSWSSARPGTRAGWNPKQRRRCRRADVFWNVSGSWSAWSIERSILKRIGRWIPAACRTTPKLHGACTELAQNYNCLLDLDTWYACSYSYVCIAQVIGGGCLKIYGLSCGSNVCAWIMKTQRPCFLRSSVALHRGMSIGILLFTPGLMICIM